MKNKCLCIIMLFLVSNITWGQAIDPNLKKGLVAYFPFNGNVKDLSGKNNHGTNYGASLAEDRFGKKNGAYEFDGFDDFIDLGNDPIGESESVSIALWVYPEGGNYIISSGGQASSIGYAIACQEGQFWFGRATSDSRVSSGYFGSFEKNSWHHVVASFNSEKETLTVYINGKLYSTYKGNKGTYLNEFTTLCIGKPNDGNTYYFKGKVDDLYMFNRELSADDIWRIYNGENNSSIVQNMDVPISIGTFFEEANTCYNTDCFTASAVMVRKTLEEVCKDKEIGGENKSLRSNLKALGKEYRSLKGLSQVILNLNLFTEDMLAKIDNKETEVDAGELEVSIEATKEILKIVYADHDSLIKRIQTLK